MSTRQPLYHVLLVEDDDVLAACAAQYLTTRGLQVDTVSDADSALTRLTGQPYDAVVTDLDLTGRGHPDGLTVVAAAARVQPRPTIILVWSGSTSGPVSAEARRLGADVVMEKSRLAELAHALAAHLGIPHTLADPSTPDRS